MVLVPVCQHDGHNVLEPIRDGREIREDQVDTWLGLRRKEDPAIDDEDGSVDLEEGHVAADITQAT
jgi:hypothetical protein